MERIKKIFIFFLIIFILINICTYSFAEDDLTAEEVIESGASVQQGTTGVSSDSLLMRIFSTIYQVVSIFGIGYVIIKFTVLGIKYFTASSMQSPKEITDVKAQLANHAVVSFVILFAETLFGIIWNALVGTNTQSSETEGDSLILGVTAGVNSLTSMGTSKLSSLGISTNILSPVWGIAQVLYTVGCGVVVAGTIYLAIKYGMGDPGEKAGIKGKLIGWAITCVILIAPVAIWRLVVSIGT